MKMCYEKSVHIKAPIDEVFKYINNPDYLVSMWPNLQKKGIATPKQKGGFYFEFILAINEHFFEGETECVAYKRDRLLVYETKGNIVSTILWIFTPLNITETELEVTFEITDSENIVNIYPLEAFHSYVSKNIEILLQNLERGIEGDFDIG